MAKVSEKTFDTFKSNKQLKEEDIQVLRDWLNRQPHLPNINEYKLMAFLHACAHNIESAKKFIENFYVIRAKWPEFSKNRDLLSPEFQIHLQTAIITDLPTRTEEDYRVIYVKLIDINPDHCDLLTQYKIFDMNAMTCLTTGPVSAGLIGVTDLDGLTFSHMLKINLVDAAKIAYYVQKAHNRSTRAVHVVNGAQLLNKLLMMVKPFLSKKMLDKVYLHENLDSLFKHVPNEIMPNELDGQAGSLKELHERYIKALCNNADFLRELEQDVADLSLKPEIRQDLDAIFGIDGTFRKLDID